MSPTTGNRNMAAQTGITYISGTMIDSVEIPTAKRGFSTMTSSNQMPTTVTECDNGRRPEMPIRPPTPEMLVSVEKLQMFDDEKYPHIYVELHC